MISRALLFGVAVLFALAPAAAFATTTPSSPQPRCTLSASRSAVELGKTVNLSWQSQYATQGFITSIGTVGTNGTQGVIPTGNGTTYVGTFTGPGGVGNCSITVSIIQPNGGGVGETGTVPEPDKLPPSQSAGAPPILPPADDTTLSKTENKGLIPCKGLDCEACDLATLAQKIINFLLGLSIPLAAVMFAYAGVIYFSSGVETSINKIEKAHAIFRSVGIGFMIVLAAWLGVNTILHTILDPKVFPEGSWFTIKCITVANDAPGGRQLNKSITDLLSVLPGLNTNILAPVSGPSTFDNRFVGEYGAPTPTCTDGYQLSYDMGGNQTCWNSDTDTYKEPASSYSGTSGSSQWNQQLAEACSKNGLSDCLIAQSILLRESGGRAGAVSNMGAGGLMQIMPATARGLDPERLGGMSDAEVRQILTSEPFYNLDLGTKELSRLNTKYNGDLPSIAAAYNGGDKANVCGKDCIRECGGGTAWQCTAFPRYAETRKYVPNVVATYTSLRK